MTVLNKTIYVYDGFSEDAPVLIGSLFVNTIRGGERYSFEYDSNWLAQARYPVDIDPHLPQFRGRLFPDDGRLFGVFSDASPDRWGRVLLNKRERILADREGRKPSKLYDSDYLIGVSDLTRMGGLRFRMDPDGSFVSDDNDTPVPPWTSLRALESAAQEVDGDETTVSEKWLTQLIRPGSSLGGARPKSTVIDASGELWIAKFPSRNDDSDVGAWEKVTHDLAGLCGLRIPESKLECFSKYGSTFLVKRFDRENEKRVHFASAMTLLGKHDGQASEEGVSYLDIASFIRASGAHPAEDLIELWKRIVFSMAVNNTDDHLRNHAFILNENGWTLSPAYDINPVPYGNELSLNVDEYDSRISKDTALRIAPKFGINKMQADIWFNDITGTVTNNWQKLALSYEISRRDIEHMRPAFSNFG